LVQISVIVTEIDAHFGCILIDHANLGVAYARYHVIRMWR